MKRTILIIAVIVLSVCMMTGCKAQETAPLPTAEEVKAIVPQKANLSLQAYPILEMPVDPEEYFAQIPAEYRTFTYKKEEWVEDTEAMEELKKFYIAEFGDATDVYPIYKPADGSKDKSLTIYQEDNSYELYIGLLKEDRINGPTYREQLYYDADGKVQYYSNTETGFMLDKMFAPDEQHIGVVYEDVYYEYVFEFGKLDRVDATERSLMDYSADEASGFCFTYYPDGDAFREISYEYYVYTDEENYISYSGYYTDEGELESIDYYRSADYTVATYDSSYNIEENGSDEYADYSFLDYLKDMYLPSITTD